MVSLTKMGYYSLTNFSSLLTKNRFSFQKIPRLLFHSSFILDKSGQEIKMPSLSPTMSEGKIIKWLKKEGDPINPGDVLCDIETDKAVMSMETEEEGILAKILVPENTGQVKVGSLIAIMVANGEDWKDVDVPSMTSSDSGNNTSVSNETQSSSSHNSDHGPSSIQIKMPSLSPTMTAGNIVKWHKKEGDTISPGDVLCDVETDKAIMSVETEEEGILAKILFPENSKKVEVGTLIALMVPEGENWQNVMTPPPSRENETTNSLPARKEISDTKIKNYGPAVKLLLSSYQIEPNIIKPSGREGRLLKEDVLKYIKDNKLEKKSQKPASTPPSHTKETEQKLKTKHKKISKVNEPNYTDKEISNMRRIIGKRLVQSKTEIPHAFSIIKCNASNLLKAKEDLFKNSIKVSLNDLIVKSTASALQIYPKANALWINNELKVCNYVDISIAVATNAGLYTPIIKTTNLKNVVQISEEIRRAAEKAKAGKLLPEEYMGGTFTISNLGMFNITHFQAIINPPQCGILAVGGITVSLDPDLKVQKNITLCLSYDSRAMNEYEAIEFMEILKHVLENPKLTLVGIPASSSLGL